MSENQASGSAPEPMEYFRVDPATGNLQSPQPAKSEKPQFQKPTAPNPAPPEVVNKEDKALAVVTSPDVCKSPKVPIPYMTWGMGEDDLNYSPDVRANGRIIKLQTSKFSCCYGDEPGVGKGVKSGTVGDVVEPVTSSTIVRANGQWVQRHTDTCTLNKGNAPGEYIYVKCTDAHKAPDGADAQDKTRNEKIAEYAESKGWTRGADGGWNTNGGGWASNDKVGEEMDYVNSGRGNVQPLSLGSGPSEIKAYTPSWTERLEGSVQDGLMSLGMDKYQAGEYGRKVGTVAGFVPGLGNSLSANDAKRSFDAGQYLLSGVQAIGAVIGIGPGKPLAKGLEKGAEKLVQKEAEQAAAKALEEKAAKEAAETAGKGGLRVSRGSRTIEELLPNGKVPGNRNGEFSRWFDGLSPDELDALWKDDKIRDIIEDRIRNPGNLHEWFMVSRTPTFKRWGVPMSDIKDLRTLTSETGGINPNWMHGGQGSTTAHNELLNIIDNSLSREDFTRQLNNWANYRLTNGVNDLPHGLRIGN
jgi:hypothetical protein